jgi:hypothetical protein
MYNVKIMIGLEYHRCIITVAVDNLPIECPMETEYLPNQHRYSSERATTHQHFNATILSRRYLGNIRKYVKIKIITMHDYKKNKK